MGTKTELAAEVKRLTDALHQQEAQVGSITTELLTKAGEIRDANSRANSTGADLVREQRKTLHLEGKVAALHEVIRELVNQKQ